MIKFNSQEFTQNQAAKVLLREALNVAKENMSDEFKFHVGLDLGIMTVREEEQLQKSIDKWCARLLKALNVNFEYSLKESDSEEEQCEEMEYFQLKSGGFAAKGYYEE